MDWDIVAVVAAGASVFLFVFGLGWDFKFAAWCGCVVHEVTLGSFWYDPICETHTEVFDVAPPSEIIAALHRSGRHLDTSESAKQAAATIRTVSEELAKRGRHLREG